MKSLILIMISGALINNVVLNQFLGICSFLGVSKQMKASASLGGAVIFVMTIASAVASLLYDFVLKPYGLDFMKTIVFILVIAALVQIVEMFLKKKSPAVYQSLGIYLPLITTNCAVLGIALTNVQNEYNFIESVLAGFGTRDHSAGRYPFAHPRGRPSPPRARRTDRSDLRGAHVDRVHGLLGTGVLTGGAA